jgi:hypothetical protein
MKKLILTLVFVSIIASLSSCTLEEIQQGQEAQSTLSTSKEADAVVDEDRPVKPPR